MSNFKLDNLLGSADITNEAIDEVKWDANGLVPVIAQDYKTGQVLMFAWMNREALELTIETEHAVYWSRSRGRLWHKGEQSGNQQDIKAIKIDCDKDALLIRVKQIGDIACHTGHKRCFYKKYKDGKWVSFEKPLKSQREIYKRAPYKSKDSSND